MGRVHLNVFLDDKCRKEVEEEDVGVLLFYLFNFLGIGGREGIFRGAASSVTGEDGPPCAGFFPHYYTVCF